MEQKHAEFFILGRMQADRTAVQGNPVARGKLRAQRRDLAVDLQAPFAYPTLHFAARTYAGGGQQLLNALGGRRFLARASLGTRASLGAWASIAARASIA